MAKKPDWFASFAGLASCQVEGTDYRRRVDSRRSPVAIIAPHGGSIESHTSQLAEAIAGADFSLYRFEGIRKAGNQRLHITSERFDEPLCLRLIRHCDVVVAVHGRNDEGDKEGIYLGGRDKKLRDTIGAALAGAGFRVKVQGHKFPGTKKSNVCNRGRRGKGVQLELPGTLRTALRRNPKKGEAFTTAIRQAIGGHTPR